MTTQFVRLSDKIINVDRILLVEWHWDDTVDYPLSEQDYIRIVYAPDCEGILIPRGSEDAKTFEAFMDALCLPAKD